MFVSTVRRPPRAALRGAGYYRETAYRQARREDGVRFTFSNLPAVGWKLPLRDTVTMARRCEDAGFERFAVADLQFHYDVVAVMTACAAATRRIVVESLVTNPYTRDAALLACAWASVADLSDGRAIFGIGGGV